MDNHKLTATQLALLKQVISYSYKKKNGDRFTFYALLEEIGTHKYNFDELLKVEDAFKTWAESSKSHHLTPLKPHFILDPYLFQVSYDKTCEDMLFNSYYDFNKTLEITTSDSGSKNVKVTFDFFLDKEGAEMLEGMLEAINKLPSGEVFSEDDIWRCAEKVYNVDVYERNLPDLINIFNLYCSYFNRPYTASGEISGYDLMLYRYDDK